MGIFVIAPLTLDPEGKARVDDLRRLHDPHADLVEPHFTMVFAVDDDREAETIDWARHCAAEASGGYLQYVWAKAHLDYRGSAWYLFLMPEIVPPALEGLERRLNAGPAQGAIVTPFDAHLTVGRFQDQTAARDMADKLTISTNLEIEAQFEALVVLRFDGVAERSRTRIPLGRQALGR